LNAKEVSEILDAAKANGVYLAEAMRLRHSSLAQEPRKVLCGDKMIGEVFRVLLDYGMLLDMPNLPIPSTKTLLLELAPCSASAYTL
jgi:predicted dehydrogenase